MPDRLARLLWCMDATQFDCIHLNLERTEHIPFQNNLIPIEVKSGDKGTLKSLHLFMTSACHTIAIRISSMLYLKETIKLENKSYQLYNIPFYGISQIENVLERVSN